MNWWYLLAGIFLLGAPVVVTVLLEHIESERVGIAVLIAGVAIGAAGGAACFAAGCAA